MLITEFETGDGKTSTLHCPKCETRWTRPLNAQGFVKRGNKPSCPIPTCGFTNPREGAEETPKPKRETPTPDPEAPKGAGRIEHYQMRSLVRILSAGVLPYMHGPAGSGKSYGARSAATELGLQFRMQSMSAGMDETVFLGYMDANGNYNRTAFRDVFENGGAFLIDEADAGSPHVLTVLQGALALSPGESMEFPDGMIDKHETALFIVAGNTIGKGADERYVGRQPLDAAFLNRFAFIDWHYDDALELALAGDESAIATVTNRVFKREGKALGAIEWTKRVQTYRKAIDDANVDLMATPRASLMGARLFDAGFGLDQVESMTLWQGADADTVSTVQRAYKEIAKREKMGEVIDNATSAITPAFV